MTTNLSGSLSEFSLAEVLSLLGMGGRTARMQVTSPGAVGTVHLVEGRISSASADSARAGLLRGVVAALPVPADDLAHALNSEDPVRSLVESGVVDRDAAQQVAGEHCTESVGEMLGWTSGEFAVWVGSPDPSDIGVRLEVEALVGAARERAQEWADLRAALPESDTVLALVPDVAQAPVVDVDDWAVLARVDGRRTLAEVLASMGASPLAAGTRLVELMGRGLVAVRTDGGDVEAEHAQQLIDAFEAGGPNDPAVTAEGTVGLVDSAPEGVVVAAPAEGPVVVAADASDVVPEVHDLFVTEPEAVEEWQEAAGQAWVAAAPASAVDVHEEWEPAGEERVEVTDWAALVAPDLSGEPEAFLAEGGPAEGEPRTYELEPVDFATEAAAFDVGAGSFEPEAVEFADEPAAYVLEPVLPEPAPEPLVTEVVAPAGVAQAVGLAPVSLDVEPVTEPVAESFAWSPWAQEMGLGEAPVAAVQQAPFGVGGFADMVEDAGGHGHTDSLPVPQAPVSGFAPETSSAFTPAPVPEVDETAQFVPQPRDPGDGVVDPSTYAQAAGAHAARSEYVDASMVVTEPADIIADEPQAEAPDPLAGGLLAHLMSSVRGL